MSRNYKAVFFDWDGTAVVSRKAKADAAADAMRPLLARGIKLVIVSGTTIENIAGGRLQDYFNEQETGNLFLGLGRGAYNYRFTDRKEPAVFSSVIPDRDTLLQIHQVCFDVHTVLLREYGLETDIVFSRPNYCKIDLMVNSSRGDHLFMQEDELGTLKKTLKAHGIQGGLRALIDITEKAGKARGLSLSATCDAKYLEAGLTCKSDNVNTILNTLKQEYGIEPEECCYWGDEYVGADSGLYGSDSYMITDITRAGSFFDVSGVSGERPREVEVLGGGVERFLQFLREQQ